MIFGWERVSASDSRAWLGFPDEIYAGHVNAAITTAAHANEYRTETTDLADHTIEFGDFKVAAVPGLRVWDKTTRPAGDKGDAQWEAFILRCLELCDLK